MSPRRTRQAKFHPVVARSAYLAARAGMGLINVGGVESSARVMRQLAGVWAQAPLNRKRLTRAIDNIAWCFPDWPRQPVEQLAVQAYHHLFMLVSEVVMAPRLVTADGYPLHVDLGDLGEGLHALCADRPCILITGHCGNWELLGYMLALQGFPMHALYRPLDLAPLDAWVAETRSRHGLTLVDKFGAAAHLPRLLESRTPVAFIADQNAGDGGLFVPFFDRLASSYKAIGLLAARYDAVILCGHARRLYALPDDRSNGSLREPSWLRPGQEPSIFRYRFELVDVIRPEHWEDAPDPVYYITARYRRAIETMVRRSPEQYLWMHRYWKSRPRHERMGRPFPPALREKIASLPWMTDQTLERIVDRSQRDAREIQEAGLQRR